MVEQFESDCNIYMQVRLLMFIYIAHFFLCAGLNLLLVFVPIAWSIKYSGYKEDDVLFLRKCLTVFHYNSW